MSPRQEEVQCPECGAENAWDSKFCESCGLVITSGVRAAGRTGSRRPARSRAADAADDASPARPRRRRAKPDQVEGREIERQLSKARETLKSLRMLFGIFGAVSLVPTAFLLFAFVKVDDRLREAILLPTILSTVFTVFMFAGVVYLFAQPLFFTITAACLSTLLAILILVDVATVWDWIFFGLFALVALGAWFSLPMVLNIMRLKRDYPNLITSAKLKKREGREVGTSAARVRDAERRAIRRQAAMKTYGIVGGIVVLAIAALIIYKSLPDSPPPAFGAAGSAAPRELSEEQKTRIEELFDPAVAKFAQTWKNSDEDAIAKLGSKEFIARRYYKFQGGLRKRDWQDEFPPIELVDEFGSSSVTKRQVWFDIDPRGQLKTHWLFEEDRWTVDRIVFSRTLKR